MRESQYLAALEPIPGLRLAFLLSKFGSPRKHQLLGGGIEPGRRLERLVDPGEQVAIDEQLLAQQRRQVRQAPAEAGTQLQILEQEQGDQGGPNLYLGHTPSKSLQLDDIYDTFHIYALEWYPDHMDFFVDGRQILTYTKDQATGWAFDGPMYLIMNIACGGPDEPAPDDSKLPQFMTVDYVRVYQKTGAGEKP